MHLVERALAQHDPGLVARQRHGALPEVEVDIAAAGRAEALVETAQPVPEPAVHEQAIGFRDAAEPALGRGACQHRDVEQPVAVLPPRHRGEQRILGGAVVARHDRAHLDIGAEMEGERADRTRGIGTPGLDRPGKKAGRGEARPVDPEPDQLPARLGHGRVDRGCRRGTAGKPQDPQIDPATGKGRRLDRAGRAAIDHQDLAGQALGQALIGRAKAEEGARQFARHVMGADHEAQVGHGAHRPMAARIASAVGSTAWARVSRSSGTGSSPASSSLRISEL